LPDADGRTLWARRYRDLTNAFADDLGGVDRLSQMKLALVRRTAAITVEIERLECRLADGDASVDVDVLGRLVGHLRRLIETLGVDRVSRDVTPSLADILRGHAEAPEKPAKAQRSVAPTIMPAEPEESLSDLASPPVEAAE
jgi:hypothetical protein